MKLLIIGFGFIGRHVARIACKEGHDVTILDRRHDAFTHGKIPLQAFVVGDVRDAK